MSKKVFSPAVGAGLAAIAIASFSPFAALAQSVGSLIEAPEVEIVQMPEAVDNSAVVLPEETIVFSQTDQFAMRVYNPNGTLQFNLYNKQTGVTEVLGAPATVESTQDGYDLSICGRANGRDCGCQFRRANNHD